MTRLLALFLALLLPAGLALAQPVDLATADPAARETVVEYGGPEPVVIETGEGAVTISALIAETPSQRQRGLMWREELAPDSGMLFDFQVEQPVSIWMRNTLISLDILYIRPDGTIAKIIAHAQPGSRRQLLSGEPVIAVLEINAGRAAELGIAPGDQVRHAMFDTALEAGDAGEAADEAQPEEG